MIRAAGNGPPHKIVDMVYHNLPDLLQPAMALQFQVIYQC